MIGQWSASESDRANLTALNRAQCVHDLIPGLQQQLCQRDEGKAGFGRPNTPALHLAKETNRSVLLELSGLNAEIGLRGMQLLRSSSESLSLQDGQQIPEMAKLGPFIHNAPLDKKWCSRLDSKRAANHFSACGNSVNLNSRYQQKVYFGHNYASWRDACSR